MLKPIAVCLVLATACAADDAGELGVAALSVNNLPAPGSLGTPIEALAAYDSIIDSRASDDHCGDGSMREGVAAVRDYLATFGIDGKNYAGCGGFHSFGQALDVYIDGYAAKQAFAQWLTANDNEMARRLGLVQIIWDSQMWRSYDGGDGPKGGWGPYFGTDPHVSHVHVSFGEAGARGETSFFTQIIGHASSGAAFAFQANTHDLWTHAGPTGLGMMPTTSPSIAGPHVAFQANTGSLFADGVDRQLGMAPGTSPSIARTGVVAFQANTGNLFVDGADQHLGMAAGTSPDLAVTAGGEHVVAFQANTHELWVRGAPTGLGMAHATSPALVALAGGGYAFAFQANTGELWIGNRGTGLGMAPGTSPALAPRADGGYRFAFQANDNSLWIDGAPTGLGMAPGTSPAIDARGNVLFQANDGAMWKVDASGPRSLSLGMAAGSSPAISEGL